MDFWEGFLLGPLWSDTDYESRRHAGQLFGIGLVVWVGIALIVLFPDRLSFLISTQALSVSLVLFVALTLVTPFVSRIYYRCPFPIKILILLLHLLRIVAGMLVPVNILLAGFELDITAIQEQALSYLDEYLGGMIDRFTDTYQGIGMIIGLIVGGLSLFLMGVGITIAALIIPRLIVAFMKIVQWVYDSFLFRVVFRRIGFSGS